MDATDTKFANKRIVLISYEFTYGTFSGNGVLARSLVKSLLKLGCQVTVWCCRPPLLSGQDEKGEEHTNNNNKSNKSQNGKDHPLQVPELEAHQVKNLQLIGQTITNANTWHRLDHESAWQEFTWKNLAPENQETLQSAIEKANAVLYVDWTGHHAWTTTPFSTSCGHENPSSKLVYLNFRVFSNGITCPQQRQWYDQREIQAVDQASLVVVLSEKDKATLLEIASSATTTSALNQKFHVLVPPLRGDVEELALEFADFQKTSNIPVPPSLLDHVPPTVLQAATITDNNNSLRKCFIACVVRLSPEKNVRRFVRFIEAAAPFLKQHNLIPLLAGSASDAAYADQVKTELQQICSASNMPFVMLDSFLSHRALAAIFTLTHLNFHPASYDAYGMTIMEAAAFGVPSVIAAGRHVGASIHVGNGASISVDFDDDDGDDMASNQPHDNNTDADGITSQAVQQILAALSDLDRMEQMRKEAQQRALAWDENAYGKTLLQHIENT